MTVVIDRTVTVPKKPAAVPPPVRVNGVAIEAGEIVREMQHHPAEKATAAWHEAARALAVRELLRQRAQHLAIEAEPMTDDSGRRETEEEAQIRALLEREAPVPEPDAETCRRYYERHLERFRSPDIYEAAHILFAAVPSDREAYAQARADAEAVLAALAERPESFDSLARAYSRCPSAAQGGNLGQLTRGQTTPEFERALLALAPGELSAEPVATRYGFHLIRLDRKIEGKALPYEAVASRIADFLREAARRQADAQYVARLVAAAEIEGIALAPHGALHSAA